MKFRPVQSSNGQVLESIWKITFFPCLKWQLPSDTGCMVNSKFYGMQCHFYFLLVIFILHTSKTKINKTISYRPHFLPNYNPNHSNYFTSKTRIFEKREWHLNIGLTSMLTCKHIYSKFSLIQAILWSIIIIGIILSTNIRPRWAQPC